MSLNNTLTNADVMGLYEVNVEKVKNNVKRYGRGNRNVSPNITSPRLNNLPAIGNMPNENEYNVPRPVPKMKMPMMPVKNIKKNNKNNKNNKPPPTMKVKQNRKTRRNRKTRKN